MKFKIASGAPKAAVRRCSSEKVFLKISQYSQENNCVGVSFLIMLQAFRPATLLKRDSNIGVFLRILRTFKEQLFYRTPPLAASGLRDSKYHAQPTP